MSIISYGGVGFTLFFTGLSGSGKSTLAGFVQEKLIESGQRPVTLLDGDIVRQNLPRQLGFSRAHRDLNVRRVGSMASEISKAGGVAICALIAPYRSIRSEVRKLTEQHSKFIEIYLSTPLSVCEQRDTKGLYAKARAGEISQFTGISDPYELPDDAELVIDTSETTRIEGGQQILDYLMRHRLIQKS
jgi:sulfate adenylyltransferase